MFPSHRLSVQNIVVSGTAWLQFAMQVLTGCEPTVWGRGGRVGLTISSPVATSCRLFIVTIGLPLTVFAVLRLVADRRTEGQTELV